MRSARRLAIALAATLCAVVAAGWPTGAASAKGNPYPNDHKLSIADVQMLGTHNSYHLRPNGSSPGAQDDYEHPSLDVQLSKQGVRSFELDAFNGPTFPVQHSIIVDEATNCATLSLCLGTIASWSRATWRMSGSFAIEPSIENTPSVQMIFRRAPRLAASFARRSSMSACL